MLWGKRAPCCPWPAPPFPGRCAPSIPGELSVTHVALNLTCPLKGEARAASRRAAGPFVFAPFFAAVHTFPSPSILQVGFDLVENELQSFLTTVTARLDAAAASAAPPAEAPAAAAATSMETDEAPAAAPAAEALAPAAAGPSSVQAARLSKLKDILSGKTPIVLYLDFLYR
jgi:hypothetical protein